jgi:hypothetical protein
MSFFRFFVLFCLFLSSLFSRQIEFKGQVLALSGHQNSAEADVVRIQLTGFDVLQKEALPNAAVAWLKNNRELRIDKKDFPAEALKELEVFSATPFYPLHLPFSQAPAIKSEGLLCTGTFSLMQTKEQWQIKDLQLKDFAFTETTPATSNNGELLSVVIPEIAQFSPLVIPSETKDLPAEQLSADESLKALDEHGNGYACGTLTNGAYYCGWFQNWRPHGKGQIRYTDGDEYTGDFLYGYRWGYGIYKYKASGDRYEGNFVQSRLEGKGTYYWAIGDRYEGAFENGKIHGQGKSVWDDGREYEGDWVQGQMQGYGTHTWPKSSAARRFTGWFYQGKPKGEGEFETDGLGDNSTILYKTKNWAVAANNGFGGAYTGSIEFRFTDGNRDSYEGEWKDLALNGSGKALFHNGDIYDGE